MQITPKLLNKKQKLELVSSEITELVLIRFNGDKGKLIEAIKVDGPLGILNDELFHREIYSVITRSFKDPLTCKEAAERQVAAILLSMPNLQNQYKAYFNIDRIPVDSSELLRPRCNNENFKQWLASCYMALALKRAFSDQVDHQVFSAIKRDGKLKISPYKLKRSLRIFWDKLSLITIFLVLIISACIPSLPMTFGGALVGLPLDLLDKSFVDVSLARQNKLYIAVITFTSALFTFLFVKCDLWGLFTKERNAPAVLKTLGYFFESAIVLLLFCGVFLKSNILLQTDIDGLVQRGSYNEAISLVISQPNLSKIKKDYILAQIYAAQFESTRSHEALVATQPLAENVLKNINYSWMQKDAVARITQTYQRPHHKSLADPIYYKFWWITVLALLILGRVSLLTQQLKDKKTDQS